MDGGTGQRNRASGSPALLTGKLRDEAGDRLTPTHTTKAGIQHRYYDSLRLLSEGRSDPSGWRLPARALEQVVAKIVAEHLRSAAQRHALLATPDATTAGAVATTAATLAERIGGPGHGGLPQLIVSGELRAASLAMTLCPATLATALGVAVEALHPELLTITAPLRLRRRGVETKLVAGEPAPAPDPTLARMLARARGWLAELRGGKPLTDLARRDGCSESYLRTRAQLAFPLTPNPSGDPGGHAASRAQPGAAGAPGSPAQLDRAGAALLVGGLRPSAKRAGGFGSDNLRRQQCRHGP